MSYGNSHGHDDDHHDEHHGSIAPFIASAGTMIFLYGFIQSWGALLIGVALLAWSLIIWWKEDLAGDASKIEYSLGEPFGGIDIRKVGIWVFIMSEVMVFGSLFSSYLRIRLSNAWTEEFAAYYITKDFSTLLPGAINTFALILSSYTIVLALRAANAPEYVAPKNMLGKLIMPDRRRAIRNCLTITLLLGTLFLVLKLYEWNHLIHDYGFTIHSSLAGSVFYVATGTHGVHVFVGLVFLLYFIYKAHIGGYEPGNSQGIEYYGLYWHFVDLAWVIIFPAFYLY